jgi:hypothetical protein
MADEFVVVWTFSSLTDAEIGKGLLESNNVPAILYGYSHDRPYLNVSMGVELAVSPEQADLAKQWLAQTFLDSKAPNEAGWVCSVCGEHCEAQFTECWKCGAPKPDIANLSVEK